MTSEALQADPIAFRGGCATYNADRIRKLTNEKTTDRLQRLAETLTRCSNRLYAAHDLNLFGSREIQEEIQLRPTCNPWQWPLLPII